MKIFLIGASGLVGYNFALAALRRDHEVFAFYHKNQPDIPGLKSIDSLDLSVKEAVRRPIFDLFPDIIVNAAAISNPEEVDANPDLSRLINIDLPRDLAQIATHISSKLIHISTDLVFDGTKGNYRSTDMPNPLSLYGKHKLEAEEEVLEYGGNFATVLRITLQVGNSISEQRSANESLFKQWSEGKVANLFTDEIRQPCTSDNVAEVILELCERNDLHGIFHWAGNEALSRYEIGLRILKHFGLPEKMIHPVSAKELCKDKPRPLDLTFELQPLSGKLKTQPPSFEQQLEELVIPRPYRKWYHSL